MCIRDSITFESGYKPVINNASSAQLVRQIASDMPIVNFVSDNVTTMVSEDFSEFIDTITGCYSFVGSANSMLGLDYAHHHPRFNIDENALTIGVSVMANLVRKHLLD